MNPAATHDEQLYPNNKGKGRAHDPATERTPLLGGASQSSSYTNNSDTVNPEINRRRLRSRLTVVFLASLSISICAFVIAVLLAWSYASQAAGVSADDILNNALVFRGPDRVDVLNITWSGGIWVNVDARIGFDAGSVIGVNPDPAEGDSILRRIWKSMGRWGVRRLDRVSVNMTTINITSKYDHSTVIASIDMEPVEMPLTANPPAGVAWLTNVTTPIFIRPTSNTTALINFVREAWKEGSVAVRADVGKAVVRGGGLNQNSWRRMLHSELSNIQTSLRIIIPPIPGLPHPGHNVPFPSLSELITLQSFNISTESDNVTIHARATLVDPAPPGFDLTAPSLPFVISLPTPGNSSALPISVCSVATDPFSLTHPNITVNVSGTVLPLPSSSASILSGFVSRYMHGEPNPILISSPILLPGFTLETVFPAPHPRPHLLRNVTVSDMKVRASGTSFLASGTILARVVLPKGVNVGLDVHRVFPDVLVFDGEISLEAIASFRPPSTPLPDPLPEHAFGHIVPEDWLPALSVIDKSENGEGMAYAVTAKIVDIPLDVLPGRQKQFSNFVSKVLFGTDGAVAGIMGTAAVAVKVHGLPYHGPGTSGELELSGLPFQGAVRIRKKGLLMNQLDLDRLKRLVERYTHHP